MTPPAAGLILALLASLGTTLGAIIVLLVKDVKRLALAGCLAMAAGVMIFVSLSELLTASKEEFSDLISSGRLKNHSVFWKEFFLVLSFGGGWILASILDWFVRWVLTKGQLKMGGRAPSGSMRCDNAITLPFDGDASGNIKSDGIPKQKKTDTAVEDDAEDPVSSDCSTQPTRWQRVCRRLKRIIVGPPLTTPTDLRQVALAEELLQCNRNEMLELGLFSFVALTIHNIPEGVATFISPISSWKHGIVVALAVGLHNIPEGIAIAIPIYVGTGRKLPAFLLSFISGFAELLGALIMFATVGSDPNHAVLAISYGATAGIMTNIGLNELLFSSLKYDPCRQVSSKAVALGVFIVAFSIVFMEGAFSIASSTN